MVASIGFGRFVFTPLLPDLMVGLQLSPADAGIIASSNYVGYLLGAVLAGLGWAAGRERPMFLWALMATTLLLAALPFGITTAGVSAIRFAAGFASAFVMVFGTNLVFSQLEAAGRNDLQAVYYGGIGIGIAVSALLLLALHGLSADWSTGWYAAAVLALVASLVSWALVPADPKHDHDETAEPALAWTRKMIAITLAYGLSGFGYVITATFLVAIVREANAHLSFEGLVWLVTGIAATPSVLLWLPIVRRSGLAVAFSAVCLLLAAGVAASVLLPAPAGPLIGGLLLGGTFVAIVAYGLQIGRLLSPNAPRRALAYMTAAFGIGQIIGPAVAGHLAEFTGSYVPGSLLAAAALLLAAVLAGFASPPPATMRP